MASKILILSIVLGAEYLSYLKSIATYALTFLGCIISVLASVSRLKNLYAALLTAHCTTDKNEF